MIWALDGQVAGTRRGRGPPIDRGRRSPRCCASATTPGCRSPPPPAAAASAARACRCTAASSLDLCGLAGIVDVDDDARSCSTSGPARSATPLEDALRARARRDPRPLAAVDRPVDRRRLARVPQRRPALHPLRQDRGHGRRSRRRARRRHRSAHRRRAARGGRARPDPAVRGQRGNARVITGARLRVHPAPSADAARRVTASPSFADGLDACRRILQRGATPAVLRLYDADRGRRATSRLGEQHVLLVLDEGDAHARRRGHAVVAEECADADGARRRAGRRAGSSTATTCPRSSAIVERLRRRHDGDRGPLAGPARRSTPRRPPRSSRSTARSRRRRTSRTRTPTARASTSPSRAAPDADARDDYYRAAWDAGTQAVLDAGGALSHHHGVGLNRARFVRGPRSATAFACSPRPRPRSTPTGS